MTVTRESMPAPGGIARIWRARATTENLPRYLAHLRSKVFPALQLIAGYRGGFALESLETPAVSEEGAPVVEIQVITWWDSLDAIRAFAGANYQRAVVEPAAQAVLVDYGKTVTHFTVSAGNFDRVFGAQV